MFAIDTQSPIAVITFEHGKVNALDLPFCKALTQGIQNLAGDACSAVIITGVGNSFSAGVDLVQLTNGGTDYVSRFLPAMDEFFHTLLTFPKPVVAALNGHALAGGCIIACCCDHVVMSDGTGRVGVTELVVGVPFPILPFEIVRARLSPRVARDLILSARTVFPAEGQALGLVDEVVPAADLMTRATDAANRLAALPAVTFELTKRAFVAPILDRVAAASAIDDEVTQAWQGDEVLSRVRTFLDQRARRP